MIIDRNRAKTHTPFSGSKEEKELCERLGKEFENSPIYKDIIKTYELHKKEFDPLFKFIEFQKVNKAFFENINIKELRRQAKELKKFKEININAIKQFKVLKKTQEDSSNFVTGPSSILPLMLSQDKTITETYLKKIEMNTKPPTIIDKVKDTIITHIIAMIIGTIVGIIMI